MCDDVGILDSRRDGAPCPIKPVATIPNPPPADHRPHSCRALPPRPRVATTCAGTRPDVVAAPSQNLICSVSNRARGSQLSRPSPQPQLGRPAANPALTPSVLTAPRLVYLHALPGWWLSHPGHKGTLCSEARIPQSGSRDHGRASHKLRRMATRSHHSS